MQQLAGDSDDDFVTPSRPNKRLKALTATRLAADVTTKKTACVNGPPQKAPESAAWRSSSPADASRAPRAARPAGTTATPRQQRQPSPAPQYHSGTAEAIAAPGGAQRYLSSHRAAALVASPPAAASEAEAAPCPVCGLDMLGISCTARGRQAHVNACLDSSCT
jgi:hypothetical protein